MLIALLTFALAGGLLVLLPGPDTLVVLRTLLRHGRRRAVMVVMGVLTGLSVWVTAAALGLSALLRASHDGYTALRVAGAIYLLWLGIQSLRQGSGAVAVPGPVSPVAGIAPVAGVAPVAPVAGQGLAGLAPVAGQGLAGLAPVAGQGLAPVAGRGLWRRGSSRRGLGQLGRGYLSGLATDLLNPKVGVFFVTFLPGFIPQGSPVAGASMALGAIFIVETALYFAVILAIAARVTGWMAVPRIRRRVDRATGLVLVGFGVRLALEP